MFYITKDINKDYGGVVYSDIFTHEVELGLPCCTNTYRLNAFLARLLIVEAQERLVRLHTLSVLRLFGNIEREFESICWTKHQRLYLLALI